MSGASGGGVVPGAQAFYVNNVAHGTASAGDGGTNSSIFAMSGFASPPACVFCEGLIYNGAITVTDLGNLYNKWLKPRWGLP